MKPNPSYNLLDERWLPVRRRSGQQLFIAPHEVTSLHERDPIVAIATPRPDLDGAALQFLIGLLQTTIAPDDAEGWSEGFDSPMTSADLERAFACVRDAFWLEGPEARFMQPFEAIEGSSCPITDLWVNAPGDNTRKNNVDFFVKRCDAPLSHAAAALSLFSLQINAYGGGPGYRTSVRGGGPLTTLLCGETLWETLWLNVIFAHRTGGRATRASSDIFPWCAPTRQSDSKKKGVDTPPSEAHLLQAYWPMSWRVSLLASQDAPEQPCALYDGLTGAYLAFEKTNYGVNYIGPWQHPLTPYRLKKNTSEGGFDYISQKGGSRSVRYTNWPSLCATKPSPAPEDMDGAELLAQNIADFQSIHQESLVEDAPEKASAKVMVFGYDMDNAKTLQWNVAHMPLFFIEDDTQRADLLNFATGLIATAEAYERLLYDALKKLLGGKVEAINKKGHATWDYGGHAPAKDSSIIQGALDMFWHQSTPSFYALLDGFVQKPPSQGGELGTARYLSWRRALFALVVASFEAMAPHDLCASSHIRTVVYARKELRIFGDPTSSTLRKLEVNVDAPV